MNPVLAFCWSMVWALTGLVVMGACWYGRINAKWAPVIFTVGLCPLAASFVWLVLQ